MYNQIHDYFLLVLNFQKQHFSNNDEFTIYATNVDMPHTHIYKN